MQWHSSVFVFLACVLLFYYLPFSEVWSNKETDCEHFDVAVNLIYLIQTGISLRLSPFPCSRTDMMLISKSGKPYNQSLSFFSPCAIFSVEPFRK